MATVRKKATPAKKAPKEPAKKKRGQRGPDKAPRKMRVVHKQEAPQEHIPKYQPPPPPPKPPIEEEEEVLNMSDLQGGLSKEEFEDIIGHKEPPKHTGNGEEHTQSHQAKVEEPIIEIDEEIPKEEALKILRKIATGTTPLSHALAWLMKRKMKPGTYRFTDEELENFIEPAKELIRTAKKVMASPKLFWFGFPMAIIFKTVMNSEPIKDTEE